MKKSNAPTRTEVREKVVAEMDQFYRDNRGKDISFSQANGGKNFETIVEDRFQSELREWMIADLRQNGWL